jgi:hypothetical protein
MRRWLRGLGAVANNDGGNDTKVEGVATASAACWEEQEAAQEAPYHRTQTPRCLVFFLRVGHHLRQEFVVYKGAEEDRVVTGVNL